ncbi:MAG: molybdopterin cofactor-binding domain-containing protein, partial [Pseudomonadota bacterium]
KPGHTFAAEGDIRDALKGDEETGASLDAVYETPFLPHLCMEPMNATARFEDGVLEVWAPSQSPLTVKFAGRKIGAKKTICHTTFAGGGFGRRGEMDFASEAARLAKAVPGRPVKVIWSRADDISQDAYRPAAAARVRGRLGADGALRAFDFKAALPSVGQSFSRRNLPVTESAATDPLNVEGADTFPYATQARRVSAVAVETPVPVGYWRSVGHSNNAFFTESFINEAAHAAGADPIAFRRRHLQGSPRLLGVLDALEAASGWGAEAAGGDDAEGWRAGAGAAIHASFRSFVGFVVEVLVSPQREIRLRRIICAADCGVLVNPDQVRAQMEGSAIFALSAALWHEVEIVGGRVTQSNFDGAPLLTLAQTPQIDVRLIESDAPPGGAGEPGVPPVAPALAAAIFAATGDRVRRLPVAQAGYAVGSAVF